MYCIVTVVRFVIVLIKFYVCMYAACNLDMYQGVTLPPASSFWSRFVTHVQRDSVTNGVRAHAMFTVCKSVKYFAKDQSVVYSVLFDDGLANLSW